MTGLSGLGQPILSFRSIWEVIPASTLEQAMALVSDAAEWGADVNIRQQSVRSGMLMRDAIV